MRPSCRDLDVALHPDRLIYDVTVVRRLAARRGGRHDRPVAWLTVDEAGRAAADAVHRDRARAAGRCALDERAPHPVGRVPYEPPPAATAVSASRRTAWSTDPAGRVLLTLIAPGYPGAGRWHLPGGGTDHGEQPAAGLAARDRARRPVRWGG